MAKMDSKQEEIIRQIIEKSQKGDIAWLFDIDKTLAIKPPGQHSGFEPDNELHNMLEGLQTQNDGAVGLITGRPYMFIKTLLPDLKIFSATEHGAIVHCRLKEAELRSSKIPDIERLQEKVIDEISGINGAQIEGYKTATMTVEFTRAANPFELGEKLEKTIKEYIASKPELSDNVRAFNGSVPGNCYIEILHKDVDKGVAIEELMSRAEFEGKTPVYCGDSEPDRSGMKMAQDLGGYAIGVTEYAPEIADVNLDTYVEMRQLLREVLKEERSRSNDNVVQKQAQVIKLQTNFGLNR